MKKPSSIVRRTAWPTSVSDPVATPLQPSVVYASPDMDMLDAQYEGRANGYAYAREGHPNADVLAQKIDMLEGCEGGIILGSGMAAVGVVMLGLLTAGDHVLGGNQLYGRSLRLMHEDLPRFGIETSVADPTDISAMRAALRPNTKMILVEVVSNPTLRVADIVGLSALAQETGCLLAVDNTFTTPRGFQAFDHGADIVVHSVTKLLAGHSDATLGYVCAKSPDHQEAINIATATWGMTPSPFDCWLAERGLYSFELRYDRAEENAKQLAEALSQTQGVARVLYPTRSDHPDHNRAVALLGDRGANMVSFELTGGRDMANSFVQAAEHIAFAPTLGDIGTTLSNPSTSSHRALTAQARADLGMGDGFFRVSVGVEDINLLISEFQGAIQKAAKL